MRRSPAGRGGVWEWCATSILPMVLIAGCSGGPERIDPGRPYPSAQGSGGRSETGVASLRILTDSYLFGLSQDNGPQKMRYFTGYTIYDEAGSRVGYVPEQSYEPARKRLPPGRYLILLDRPGRHAPVFWVTVQPDRITDVSPPERREGSDQP